MLAHLKSIKTKIKKTSPDNPHYREHSWGKQVSNARWSLSSSSSSRSGLEIVRPPDRCNKVIFTLVSFIVVFSRYITKFFGWCIYVFPDQSIQSYQVSYKFLECWDRPISTLRPLQLNVYVCFEDFPKVSPVMFPDQPLLLSKALPSDHIWRVHSCHLVLVTVIRVISLGWWWASK